MSAEEKAKKLVDEFRGLVYPYIGSSMLTNDQDEGVILYNSKQCALIAAGLLINEYKLGSPDYEYWQQVKAKIQSL